MAILSLAQLTRVVTVEEARELLLDILVSLRFPARSWQEGSNQRSLVEAFARMYASVTEVVRDMAAGGYNDTAVGAWLDLYSLSEYRHRRKPAVRTRGYVRLVAAPGAPGPFTLQPLDLVLSDSTGQTFRNVAPITLTGGQTLAVLVEAESAGAAGDVAVGALTELKTPLAGVSVSNPVLAGDTTWITVNGADAESDEALRERNANKWGTLGAVAMPRRGYAYHALQADTSVRRVYVDDTNPRGPGTITVYVAGDAGALSGTVVSAVNAHLIGTGPDGIDKRAAGADVVALSALVTTVQVKATVYLVSGYNTAATQQGIAATVADFFRDLPIGGRRYAPGQGGVVPFGELYRALLNIPGVRNAAFVTPLADVPLAASAVAVPTLQLTYESV